MRTLSRYRVLFAGILSPFAAIAVLVCISFFVEHWSARFHSSVNAIMLAMSAGTALPFVITGALAMKDHRRQLFNLAGKIGLAKQRSLSLFRRGLVTRCTFYGELRE